MSWELAVIRDLKLEDIEFHEYVMACVWLLLVMFVVPYAMRVFGLTRR